MRVGGKYIIANTTTAGRKASMQADRQGGGKWNDLSQVSAMGEGDMNQDRKSASLCIHHGSGARVDVLAIT